MPRRILSLATASVLLSTAFSADARSDASVLWATSLGTGATDGVQDLLVDRNDAVYVTCAFSMSYHVLSKYDGLGRLLWRFRVSPKTNQWRGQSLAADPGGELVVSGMAKEDTAFLVKYSPAGRASWSRSFSSWQVTDVAIDPHGGILAGVARQRMPGLLRKFSSGGDSLWTRSLPAGLNALTMALGVGVDGHATIAGNVDGIRGLDVLLQNFNSSGDSLWARQFGTEQDDHFLDMTVDAAGNYGVAYFNNHLVLEKWNAAGQRLWVKEFDSPDTGNSSPWTEVSAKLACDREGNLYALIHGSPPFSSASGVVEWDPAGNERWRKEIPSAWSVRPELVAVDGSGAVVLAGSSNDDSAIEGTKLVKARKNHPRYGDVFVLKLRP